MDRLTLLLGFLAGLSYGRALDAQFRRDVRWRLLKLMSGQRGESWEQRLRVQVKQKMKRAA